MSPLASWAVVLGATLGLGLWSLVSLVPRLGRPSLASRVAPYVADFSDGARAMLHRRTVDPLPIIGALVFPGLDRVRRGLGQLLGGNATIALRLRQSGSSLTVDAFRSRQLAWALGGAAAGILLSIALARSQPLPLIAHGFIVVVLSVLGIVARDYLLQRSAAARLARMGSELPTVLEFLTLSMSAGEGVLDAIRRVSQISRGELATELGRVISEVNTGLPLSQSLNRMSAGVQLPALTRCVEQITGALERGTPLAEVFRAQAQDSREDAKRQLIEVAGKKEVAMLIPLVFLILPTTIIFAIFPGILVLQVGF
ncbi:MAG: type II secretion system F family protein [Homoserinimonas sp.]